MIRGIVAIRCFSYARKVVTTISIRIIDRSPEALAKFRQATHAGLTAVGGTAAGYAAKAAPVDTGRLRNSINFAVDDNEVYIGTNVSYAPYVALGTGIYCPGGRNTPWFYEDAQGEGHVTFVSAER